MSTAGRTPKEVLEFAKKHDAKQLDLRFTDLPGLQQHISYPISQLNEDTFEEGFGIDGSSIRGWAAINESDMLLIPDPTTAVIDPFYETQDAGDALRRHRPHHAPALRSRPALDRTESRDVSEEFRHRRHRLFRRRSRVLHFRQHPLRSERALRLLLHRRRRGPLELRAASTTTSATGRATRKATSRSRRPIIIRICARRWWRP